MIIEIDNVKYEIWDTYIQHKRKFCVCVGIEGDEEGNFHKELYISSLDSIYDDVANSPDCEGFEDCMDSHGEHMTKDVFIDPQAVWESYSTEEKLEFLKNDIIAELTKSLNEEKRCIPSS